MKTKTNTRKLWRPKRPELAEQCRSCPFRVGNDFHFGEIIKKLWRKMGVFITPSKADIESARKKIRSDLEHSGDFICHGTAYDARMEEAPQEAMRQCPGATRYFKVEA